MQSRLKIPSGSIWNRGKYMADLLTMHWQHSGMGSRKLDNIQKVSFNCGWGTPTEFRIICSFSTRPPVKTGGYLQETLTEVYLSLKVTTLNSYLVFSCLMANYSFHKHSKVQSTVYICRTGIECIRTRYSVPQYLL